MFINMSKFLVYLLVCISLHACSARPLASVDDKENKILLSSKEVTIMTSDTSKTEGRIIMSEDIGKDDGKLMWKKTSIVARNQLDDEENKGNKVEISFHEGAQVKISRRESRLMLESPLSTQHEEEAVNSIEKELVEDVVVMDYAQPHRKPPIHNTKH
ncbi:hypothetical protein MTR67_037021 [Solanum verrucosum]|uniref:Uncharacterized protein n=1 Tax=Solanum verrucosum TaxID=315347 RepID=A0AAF0ZLI5_SOLVR|nr:uncharacterized protein LOC125826572 [Solanum verrucosum]WMV43636.1 hypothetical protein MTR67_037021 [Solanum verrucosum]